MTFPYPFVQEIRKQSKCRGGMEYGLFFSKDVDLAGLKAHMCWLKLLEGAVRPISKKHQKLKDTPHNP